MAMFDFLRNTKAARQTKKSRRQAPRSRRAILEALEPRHLLSTLSLVNLPTTPVTVTAGEPLMIALTGSGATTMTYTASSGSTALTTTVLEPSANSVIQMQVQSGTNPLTATVAGDMDFQLFNNFSDMTTATSFFSNLVNTGFFNSAPGDTSTADGGKMIIFRDDSSCLQTGSTNNTNSGGGSGSSFDDAYDPNLVFSGTDVLAMAKAQNDGNDSQFFITNEAYQPWDFQYTIIGFMVRGDSIRQQIAQLPTTTNPTTGFSEPTTPVLIENMSMITDTQDAALELSASGDGGRPELYGHRDPERRQLGRHDHQDVQRQGGGQHLDRPALPAGDPQHYHHGRHTRDGRQPADLCSQRRLDELRL